ncbi:hypothetical protein PSPO01_15450 [Paraphaeosphaeria sporulosa]
MAYNLRSTESHSGELDNHALLDTGSPHPTQLPPSDNSQEQSGTIRASSRPSGTGRSRTGRVATPVSEEASSSGSVSHQLEIARQWLEEQRNVIELRRIRDIQARWESGDPTALFEPTRDAIIKKETHHVSSLRPPQKQPHEYTRKDRREFNRWRDDCELCFQSSKDYFSDEGLKVNYALQYVTDVCRSVWRIEVQSKLAIDPTWEVSWDFLKSKMLDALGSPEERRQLAYDQLKKCQQRPGQSPLDLLDYLRGCWEELGTTNLDQQKLEYVGALAPSIRQKLQSVPLELRTSIADVELQASIIYRTNLATLGPSGPNTVRDGTDRRRKTRPESGGNDTPRKPARRQRGRGNDYKRTNPAPSSTKTTNQDISCWHCGKPDHIRPDCPTLDKPPAPGTRDAQAAKDKRNGLGKGKGRKE